MMHLVSCEASAADITLSDDKDMSPLSRTVLTPASVAPGNFILGSLLRVSEWSSWGCPGRVSGDGVSQKQTQFAEIVDIF